MSARDPEGLRRLAARLPFHIQDYAAANRAYLEWRRTDAEDDRGVVLLWAYCYVHWFVLSRASGERRLAAAADVDDLITRCYNQVQDHLDSVEDAGRFVNWTTVVCFNALKSFRRRRHVSLEFSDGDVEPGVDDAPLPDEGLDRSVARRAIEGAFAQLSDSIREVARLRLIEGKSYEEIKAELGHGVPTLRVYVNKAVKKLRENGALRLLAGLTPPTPDEGGGRRKTRAGPKPVGDPPTASDPPTDRPPLPGPPPADVGPGTWLS